MISKAETDIPEDMTGGELYAKLADIGAQLLVDTIRDIEAGTAVREKQNDEESSYHPPLTKKIGKIDWTKSAEEIHNLIRALSPMMSAYSHMGGDTIKIWKATAIDGNAPPGRIICSDARQGLIVGTGDGLLRVDEMQAPGSRRMTPQEYLRGKTLCKERFD